jgi:sialic acid synthase SpsE
LIAEAGAIHLGSEERAYELVAAGVSSGANAITFQQIDEKMLYSELPELPVPSQDTVS